MIIERDVFLFEVRIPRLTFGVWCPFAFFKSSVSNVYGNRMFTQYVCPLFPAKSLYKMNSAEEVAGTSDPTKSPIRKGQPSPIGSDVMSPHQVRYGYTTRNITNEFSVTAWQLLLR